MNVLKYTKNNNKLNYKYFFLKPHWKHNNIVYQFEGSYCFYIVHF